MFCGSCAELLLQVASGNFDGICNDTGLTKDYIAYLDR